MEREVLMASKQIPEFSVKVQSGILQSLGIDMYATLGKCLVEFVANAYDGDASEVRITIPFEEIEPARKQARKEARERVKEGEIDPFTVLNEPLPEGIVVAIRDDGHGMTPSEVQDKFLPITRNRRLDAKGRIANFMSDSGKRRVMGRKGLGKLAGFGVAERIQILTKKAGDNFTTSFVLDQREFEEIKDIRDVKIVPTYISNANTNEKFTEIQLGRLKCDAVRQGDETLRDSLISNFFGINPTDFSIYLNGELVVEGPVTYDLEYPGKRNAKGMAEDQIIVEDGAIIAPFQYVVRFRQPGKHLPAKNRGARIYCNGRLAAGPSLFGVRSGLHSFHSTDYMECVIAADELDRHGIDLINTNRTQLKENNELVQALLQRVTEIMEEAVRAHGYHREHAVEAEVQTHPDSQLALRIVGQLPTRTQAVGRRLINVMARRFPLGTDEFREVAPLIVQSMNAGEVLIRLTEIGANPRDLAQIGELLRELAVVERSDVLKLYRGRRSGLTALDSLISKGEENWNKKQFEKDLHNVLKENPWLIRPEYSNYLTSDQSMSTVATELAKYLEIDDYATNPASASSGDEQRPDLVFAMADSSHPHEVHIVELKSPALALTYAHLDQLRGYMFKTEEFLRPRYSHPIRTYGTLIGTRPPPTTTADGSRRLNSEIAKRGTDNMWEVKDVRELLQDSRRAHLDIIEALEAEESEEADASGESPKAKMLPAN